MGLSEPADRLSDLAKLNFDRLGLLPLMPDAFAMLATLFTRSRTSCRSTIQSTSIDPSIYRGGPDMIRTLLRPLARILDAREKGESTKAIEKENLARRHEALRDRAVCAEGRLLSGLFASFMVIGIRMGGMASRSRRAAPVPQDQVIGQRSILLTERAHSCD